MIACAYLPYLAPVLLMGNSPLVVVKHFKRMGKVIALSPDAEQVGAARGMSVTRARAVCPKGRFVGSNEPSFEAGSEKLLDTLWTFTNRVEIDADAYPHHAICYLDLGSLRDADACLMAEEMARALRAAFGVGASVGLGHGKLTAYLAAQRAMRDEVLLVEREDEAAFISPFPIDTLPLHKADARRLHLLGIQTLGDLAALPRTAVTASFGKRGTLLHRLASGLDGRPVTPAKMPQTESVRTTFEAIYERDHLDYYLTRLTDGLARTLDKRAVAAHRLVLTIHFERGGGQDETLRLLSPVGTARGLREELAKLLARISFDKPVVGVEICAAHLVAAIPVQLELFAECPVSRGVIDLTHVLAARYGIADCFTASVGQSWSLLTERRYVQRRIEVESDVS